MKRAFAAGGLVAAAGVALPLALPAGAAGLLAPMAGAGVGGAWGGRALRLGWRPAAGFGGAFLLPGAVSPFLVLAGLAEGIAGNPAVTALLLPGGLAILYGAAGAIGAAALDAGRAVTLAGALAFGRGGLLAGFLGGAVVLLPVLWHRASPGPAAAWEGPLALAGWLLAVLVAHAAGGARFADALERTVGEAGAPARASRPGGRPPRRPSR